MLLVVGLGNPGSGYAANRHNIGFMAADELVRRYSFGPWRKKYQGQLAEGELNGQKVLVLKPETFMNNSGQSVGDVLRFYKIPIEDVIVLHDELDLPPGKLRVKRGGGHGGHNGLRSIDAHCGKEYRRVRLGIGHPGDKARVHGHVLGDFAKAEQSGWLMALLDGIALEFPRLVKGDDGGFMSKVSHIVSPPKPKQPAPKKNKVDPLPEAPEADDGEMSGAARVRVEKADRPVSNAASAMAQALARAFNKKK
ncbi:aminoacyl-tRNA hydrolase [Thalassospira alkalitolerans]|uniref:Peptidyl-tRNA hydrolase n=1 Tax=Thalassospira alkalitolerans TaxID=1293890 RepID=A0A1Y2LBD1_9PROT|nr:aminoacyl-tRNA hydrolase [Thalassospira alkalitolerans]OSQ46646.1 peptidyl-tRNA hydrolase [Thalassospira alkalitolerans]|tara:strand:+ start:41042 stop:41797 length:756 start_codon:yes stop_codon:yes gene_type:complete